MEKKISSCVILYDSVTHSTIVGHPTGRPWKNKDGSIQKGVFSLLKGELDENETLHEAAVREIEEESGIKLDKHKLKHLGRYEYIKSKDLEMFFYDLGDYDLTKCKCKSFFQAKDGKMLPEMNGFIRINLETELDMLFYAQQRVVKQCIESFPELFS